MMLRETANQIHGNGQGRERSVPAILARRRAESRRRRQVFPPDFGHGEVAVAEAYDVFGESWARRALFVTGEAGLATVGYFDDYFLVVEQWVEGDDEPWDQWWAARRHERDRVIMLETADSRPLPGLEGLDIKIDRERLFEMEAGILGVVRDGMTGDTSLQGRLRRSQIDLLSLVTLTSRLSR